MPRPGKSTSRRAAGRSARVAPHRPKKPGPPASASTPEAAGARLAVVELGRHLRAFVRAAGGRANRVSGALGRGQNYLSRAFAGRNPLKIKDVFGVFAALGEHPRPFFGRLYPLGGEPFTAAARARLFASRPEAPRFDDVIALGLEREPIPAPEQAVEAARKLLRRLILERGHTQVGVSVALGLTKGTLGQALRGGMDLEAFHLFGVLQVLAVEPSRFFRELLAPAGPPGASWAALGPLLEHLLGGASEPLARLLAALPPAGGEKK